MDKKIFSAQCSGVIYQLSIINFLQFLSRTAYPSFKWTVPDKCSVSMELSQLGMLTALLGAMLARQLTWRILQI